MYHEGGNVCPLSIPNSLCGFDSNKVAICPCLCNQTTQGDTLTISVGDNLNQICTELRVAIETVCAVCVVLEDHFDITFLLNVQILDCTRFGSGEGAEDRCGCGGHDVRCVFAC
jgi:hypothetical protein